MHTHDSSDAYQLYQKEHEPTRPTRRYSLKGQIEGSRDEATTLQVAVLAFITNPYFIRAKAGLEVLERHERDIVSSRSAK